MRKLFSVCALAVALCCGGCQDDKTTTDEPVLKNDPIVSTGLSGFGWTKDTAPEKAPRYASIRQIAAKDIPTTLDLRPEMSPVEDQGPINSCVGQAVVGGLEFLQIKAGIPKNKRFLDMSRMWVYYGARKLYNLQNADKGCFIGHAIILVTDTGVVTEKRWPYTYSRLFQQPPKSLYVAAEKKIVRDYYYLWDHTPDDIKAALAEGYPVIFGTALFTSFRAVGKDGIVPVPKPGEACIGGHAMLIVGYTDKYFIVRNSWGTNWGDKGYCYFPFEYFAQNSGAYNPGFDFWMLRSQTNLFTKEMQEVKK